MSQSTILQTITPTPFLRRVDGCLRQVARVTVNHAGSAQTGAIHVTAQDVEVITPVTLVAGESTVEVEVAEITAPGDVTFTLILNDKTVAQTSVAWTPPKHWVVHVVQLSHHDVGYTDLASNVLMEHDQMLDAVIDMADATRGFPEEARFRMVVEQSWSIDHFLHNAPPERVAAMLALLRNGDVELTALFGNMVTELCGHETLARSAYHAFRLKREFGIPILSAEHNDVPGFSWGVSQVLTEAGIKLFCPGLPTYYNWGYPDATTFWDEATLFGMAKASGGWWWEFDKGAMPGAFWWEAPTGKRVLFWCNNQGCGGDCHAEMPGLSARLQKLAEQHYPYEVIRWPVQGGARDNSPYIAGYAHTIRDWNTRWAYPRLISSTNTRFYHDLLPQLPAELPVWHGELPGQDYPTGASSTAAATGVNRGNHADLPAAEALATISGTIADYRYQQATIFQAYEEVLWHDEHTWGHHAPAGPQETTSELEKAVHAHRAAALAHDVASKAMARVADAVQLQEPGLHLVVFNPLGRERSGVVTMPLQEFDNCGSTMGTRPDGSRYNVHLYDRSHVRPSGEFLAGKFDLIDETTGAAMPFQISTLSSPYAPVPYAAQRLGQSAITDQRRYGLQYELTFTAEHVPAAGYRTYRLQPREDQPTFPNELVAYDNMLENAFYRLEIDLYSGCIGSLLDKETRTRRTASAS